VVESNGVEGIPDGVRVALIHDWLTGMRGGEKCLEVMAEMFPQADLFTLLHLPGRVSPVLENRTIHTSFVQNLPSAEKIYRWALPFFPRAIESFDLSGFDLVFSSSHCVAKSAIPAPGALSVCYCHTPMRFGGWCTTADLSFHAYGLNPYLCYCAQEKPDWPALLEGKDGKLFSLVVLENSTGIPGNRIQSFDYEKVYSMLENPLELRKIDFNEYPVFGFLFAETRAGRERELENMLNLNLNEFVSMK